MADVAKNWQIWWDGFDLSADFNAIGLATEVAKERATTFGATAHVSEPGLPEDMVEFGGFWRAGANILDEVLRARLGVSGGVFLTARENVANAHAFFLRVSQGRYQVSVPEVGRAISFQGSAMHTTGDPMVRGRLLTPNSSKASTGNSAALQVGQVASGKFLYAVLMVFSGTGTLDAIIQSDNAEGMGSPTNRITFAQQTGRAAVYATRVAGPITDDWWRVNYTIGTGPFAFAAAIGIL